MRLIDADELIAKCGDWYIEEGSEEGFIGTIKDLVEKMPTIITIEWRWIPCEEKHPDETDWYLVTLNDGRHATRWYSTIHDWERIGDNYVVAWLPNPEPYKVFAQIVDLYSGSQKND